jgi:hypothetical protein
MTATIGSVSSYFAYDPIRGNINLSKSVIVLSLELSKR